MKHCEHCGNELYDEDIFCPRCGAEAAKRITCQSCGAVLREGAKFCTACGAHCVPISWEDDEKTLPLMDDDKTVSIDDGERTVPLEEMDSEVTQPLSYADSQAIAVAQSQDVAGYEYIPLGAEDMEPISLDYVDEESKKKKRKIFGTFVLAAATCAAVALVAVYIIAPMIKYNSAVALSESGSYDEAIAIFEELGDYSSAPEMILKTKYNKAVDLAKNEKYDDAIAIFRELGKYEDAPEQLTDAKYNKANSLMNKKEYEEAIKLFSEVGDYKDAKELIKETRYLSAKELIANKEYEKALQTLSSIKDYKDADDLIIEAKYGNGINLYNEKKYKEAVDLFKSLEDYPGSEEYYFKSMYKYVIENKNNTNKTTYEYLKILKKEKYEDSRKIYNNLYSWKMSIVLNNKKNNASNDMSSISKYDTVYAHIRVSGGVPDGSTTIYGYYKFPSSNKKRLDGDGKWYNGSTSTWSFWYEHPYYGSTGTFTVWFYDSNGNLMGQNSIRLTY